MPSVQKRCCCWNSKWLSFRKKYGNPRNKLWNWRKESSQSCQRAAKQQPGPGHYVFCMHACMLDFFPYDIYICFCRTEIEGSPAKACMCMHASKLNANGISRIAVHIMHALNIYIYIIYYILIMQVSDETADTQLDETQQPPAQEEAGKPHVATLCLF